MKLVLTMLKRAVPLACASLLLVAGTAQAALQDRDLDGDTVVDAFYDTDLDITWLRDANVNYSPISWDAAVAWADGFSFGGYDDWRLPTSDTCSGYNCTGSEMGHLYYVELGNSAGGRTNSGDFQNWLGFPYWSGTENALNPDDAWYFQVADGSQSSIDKRGTTYAMAVRDGDVPSIPEPETYALMLAGLAGLAWAARRRPR